MKEIERIKKIIRRDKGNGLNPFAIMETFIIIFQNAQ